MSQGRSTKVTPLPADTGQSSRVNGLMDYLQKAISDADEQAAAERVITVRQNNPAVTADELAEIMIKQKCLQTGVVGGVTSGTAIIPGLGTLVALTFGVAADIGLTFKMQAELVLEMASVYQRELSAWEKRNTILLVTGISAGANRVLTRTGRELAEKASHRLAARSVAKAIPILGVAASAGTNILSTYIIGRRAQAYFKLGPQAVGNWSESIRAITGVDERKLTIWLAETVEYAWGLAGNSAHSVAGTAVAVGRSAGELVVRGAGKVGGAAVGAGKAVARRVADARGSMAKSIGSLRRSKDGREPVEEASPE